MNHYRVRYIWMCGGVDGVIPPADGIRDFEAPNPISALNQFHGWMQTVNETVNRRDVIRPKLKPHEYELKSLHQFYHNASLHANPASQPIIESEVDLPKTKNPDLRKLKASSDNPQPELAL